MAQVMLLNDAVDAAVPFTRLSADKVGSKFSPLGKNTNYVITTLEIEQKVPAVGTKASHRFVVKTGAEEIAVGPTTTTVSKASVSILVAIPPGMATDHVADLLAYTYNCVKENLDNLKAGVVL